MTKLLFIFLIVITGGGCSGSLIRIDHSHEPVTVDDVKVFYTHKPECNYSVMAYLQSSGGYYSLEGMFTNMRREAAKVGALGLYVVYTQKLDIGEYYGSAEAIKCDPIPDQSFS